MLEGKIEGNQRLSKGTHFNLSARNVLRCNALRLEDHCWIEPRDLLNGEDGRPTAHEYR
jgi:hypothetical protein